MKNIRFKSEGEPVFISVDRPEVIPKTFRLSVGACEKLDEASERTGLTRTFILEELINRFAPLVQVEQAK
jgi:hypothetical protein